MNALIRSMSKGVTKMRKLNKIRYVRIVLTVFQPTQGEKDQLSVFLYSSGMLL